MKRYLKYMVAVFLMVLLLVVPVSAAELDSFCSASAEVTAPVLQSLDTNTMDFTIYGTYDYAETQDFADLINQERASAGVGKLTLDPTLTDLAMQRAAELAVHYEYERPDGTDTDTLFAGDGYTDSRAYYLVGGYATAADVLLDILDDDGQYWSSTDYSSIGIGCYYQENGVRFWTVFYYADVKDSATVPTAASSVTDIPISLSLDYMDMLYVDGFDGEYVYLDAGKSVQLKLSIRNAGLDYSADYPVYLSGGYTLRSSDTAVVTAKNKKITGVAQGTATITIAFEDIEFSLPCKVSGTAVTLDAPSISTSNIASSGKIKITWNAVDGAEKYQLYRSTSKNGTYTLLKTTTGTRLNNTSAKTGQRYYYYVVAVAPDGSVSEKSNIASRTCDCAQPEVKVSNIASSGKIKISWDKVDGAKEYKLYRATSKDGEYSLLKTTTGTSLNNTSAKVGKTYYYKVRAMSSNENAHSVYSEIKSRTCDLPRPEVSITLNSSGKPKLSWDKVDGAKEYDVYRATSKSGEYSLMKTVTGTAYSNTSAKVNKTYYYKVVAVHSKSAANSAKSSVVFANCTSVDISNSKTVKDVVNKINEYRTAEGLPKLKWYSSAQLAAKTRAAELANFYGGTRPNGSDLDTLYTPYKLAGECYGYGFSSASEFVKALMNSSSLAEYALSEEFTYAVAARNGTYWTVMFG